VQSVLTVVHQQRTCTSNLRFAADSSLLAERDIDLQTLIDKVHGTSSRFELVVSSGSPVCWATTD